MPLELWNKFLRYRAMEPESRKLFWRAAALLSIAKILLRLRGFSKTRDYLEVDAPKRTASGEKSTLLADQIERTTRVVRAASDLRFIRGNCLQESLTLWHLLRKQGIETNLRIGVRRTAEDFEAHAWVEHDGTALNDTGDVHQRFAAFDTDFSRAPGEKP